MNWQDFFRECRPTMILESKIEPMEPYSCLNKAIVQKIIHVHDDEFIIQYAGGLIEKRDLSSQEADPIYSF